MKEEKKEGMDNMRLESPCRNKTASPDASGEAVSITIYVYLLMAYLRYFFRPAAAKPSRPEPRRISVAGSGT
jgi:hypothetical protein